MKIYIPTKDRQKNQITLKSIPERYLKDTWLVVPQGETGHDHPQVLEAPPECFNIATTRQWLLAGNTGHQDNTIMMIDDDLTFNIRVDGTTKLRKPEKDDLDYMFEVLINGSQKYALCSVSARQGNNHVEGIYSTVTKCTRFLVINRSFIDGERFDRTTIMDDYDFNLQLLRNGKPNLVLFGYSQDQPASNSAGGVSSYRTREVLAENARRLASLHPGYVKLVEKTTEGGWFGGGTRTDVNVQWKKAFKNTHDRAGFEQETVGELPWRTVA